MELLNLTGYFSGLQDVCELSIYPTSGRCIMLEWIRKDMGVVLWTNSKSQKMFQISFCRIQENKCYHAKFLPNRFHLIGDAHQRISSRLKQLIFREATNVSPQSDVISRRNLCLASRNVGCFLRLHLYWLIQCVFRFRSWLMSSTIPLMVSVTIL